MGSAGGGWSGMAKAGVANDGQDVGNQRSLLEPDQDDPSGTEQDGAPLPEPEADAPNHMTQELSTVPEVDASNNSTAQGGGNKKKVKNTVDLPSSASAAPAAGAGEEDAD